MWLSQLLFFQIQSCCPPPPVPPVLSFSRMHLLAAAWGESNWGGGCTCYGSERESLEVSFPGRGQWGWSWYHAGHLCWGLWDETQLNTQRVDGDPRSLFFSHRVQLCELGADPDQHSVDVSVRRENEWMKNGCVLHHVVYIFLVLIITLITLKKPHIQLQPLPKLRRNIA